MPLSWLSYANSIQSVSLFNISIFSFGWSVAHQFVLIQDPFESCVYYKLYIIHTDKAANRLWIQSESGSHERRIPRETHGAQIKQEI